MPIFTGAHVWRRGVGGERAAGTATERTDQDSAELPGGSSAAVSVRVRAGRGVVRDLAELRATWQQAAVGRGWRVPSDWRVPAVDRLLASVVARPRGYVAAEHFRSLGRARAESGAGLAETLEDLAALADALDLDALDPQAAVEVAHGWSAASEYTLAEPATDALTGLASTAYLKVRLGEVYEETEYLGEPAGRRWALVVVDLVAVRENELACSPALIEVARSLRLLYGSGQTLVRLGPVRFAALVPQSGVVIEQVELLADLVAERLAAIGVARDDPAEPVLEWHVIDLPRALDAAVGAVERLRG